MVEPTPGGSDPRPPDDSHVLRNLTAHRVSVAWRAAPDQVAVQVPPYGERVVADSELSGMDLQPWLTRGIVTCRPDVREPSVLGTIGEGLLGAFLGVGGWAGVVWLLWDAFGTPPSSYWPIALGVTAAGAILMVGAELRAKAGAGAVRAALGKLLRPLSWGRALAGDVANALAVAIVAFGVPAAVILATGAWVQLLQGELSVPLLAHFAPWVDAQLQTHPLHLTGRALQLVLIALLASLPAALYFLFDRRKLESLRQRFFRSVLVLEPDLRTLDDVASVYGARVDEVLGAATKGGNRPPVGLTRQVMVPLTTLILAVGWTVALDPVGSADEQGATSLVAYFIPRRDPMVFAFLGGYLFAIGMLLRRYVRSDLKPETLTHALVRILGAILIAWAFGVAWPQAGEPALLLVAFVIGVFPESGMDWLAERGRSIMAAQLGRPSAEKGATLSETFPLDCLDGINIYHRSRLMDEGVDNLENLAHADLVDLVLETRIPMGTLLDWVDQAVLVLHTRAGTADPGHYARLRDHGIRTATDLEEAWWQAWLRGEGDRFLAILGSVEGGPPRLRVLLDALHDDQWMAQLRQARASGRGRLTLTAELLPLWDEGEERLGEEVERYRHATALRRIEAGAERLSVAQSAVGAAPSAKPRPGPVHGSPTPEPRPGEDVVGEPMVPRETDGGGARDGDAALR